MISRTSYIILRFDKLYFAMSYSRVYGDASFATNDGLSSQLGYVVLPCHGEDWSHVFDYGSRNSKRAVQSLLVGDTYALMGTLWHMRFENICVRC